MQYIQWPKIPPVNRNGWRPSCSHTTLRAIRYRALLHGWAFCPNPGRLDDAGQSAGGRFLEFSARSPADRKGQQQFKSTRSELAPGKFVLAQPSRSANDRNPTHRSHWSEPPIEGSPPEADVPINAPISSAVRRDSTMIPKLRPSPVA